MPRPIVDLAGARFGRLTVVRLDAQQEHGKHARWVCVCDCGTECVAPSKHLRAGEKRSCGCLAREVGAKNADVIRKHGATGTPEYVAWQGMINRCEVQSRRSWKNYGGRGIRVAEEWRHDFMAFLSHVGPRPSSAHSLDRIDNDGNYRPGNVRWATRDVQNANRRPRKATA